MSPDALKVCPLGDMRIRMEDAMRKSDDARGVVNHIQDKVKHLDSLPIIASEIKHANKNNTVLLIFMAFVLLINAALVANISFRASGLGSSIEVSQGK